MAWNELLNLYFIFSFIAWCFVDDQSCFFFPKSKKHTEQYISGKSKIQLGCGVTISRAKRFLDNVIGQDHQQLESWTIWWNSYSFLSILRHQAILLIASDTSWATFMCHNAKLTWLLIWGKPLLFSNLESCQTFSFFGHSDK